jgi:hypothetical protein
MKSFVNCCAQRKVSREIARKFTPNATSLAITRKCATEVTVRKKRTDPPGDGSKKTYHPPCDRVKITYGDPLVVTAYR